MAFHAAYKTSTLQFRNYFEIVTFTFLSLGIQFLVIISFFSQLKLKARGRKKLHVFVNKTRQFIFVPKFQFINDRNVDIFTVAKIVAEKKDREPFGPCENLCTFWR